MKPHEKQLMIIFVILGILFLGLIGGIMYYKKEYQKSYFTYRGFDFKQVAGGYQITVYINEQQIPRTLTLRSDHRDIEDIPVETDVRSLIKKKEIFVTINPYDNLTGLTTMAVLELDKVLDNPNLYNIPLNASFTELYPKGGLSVKTCVDATPDIAVLWFKLEERTRIYENEGCIIIAGEQEEDLVEVADRIIYTLLGIMDS